MQERWRIIGLSFSWCDLPKNLARLSRLKTPNESIPTIAEQPRRGCKPLNLFSQNVDTNRPFQFQKCRQLFIGSHNETLPVAAMRVRGPRSCALWNRRTRGFLASQTLPYNSRVREGGQT